eukprot:ctg_597.g295
MATRALFQRYGRLQATTPKGPRPAARIPWTRPLVTVNSADAQTHFGYRQVDMQEKPQLVQDVFDSVARSYDVMNDAMSLGMHRLWKDHFVNRLAPWDGMRLVDVAGGTGDIAFRVLRAAPQAEALVVDVNQNMLQVGERRAHAAALSSGEPSSARARPRLRFMHGDAESLPLDAEQFDAYTISFGMRNVARPERALAEAVRVLRRGGRFLMMELSAMPEDRFPLLRQAYDTYSFRVIPQLGQWIANDRAAYEYLVQSIRRFPPPAQVGAMMRDAGLQALTTEELCFGVVCIYSGWKV